MLLSRDVRLWASCCSLLLHSGKHWHLFFVFVVGNRTVFVVFVVQEHNKILSLDFFDLYIFWNVCTGNLLGNVLCGNSLEFIDDIMSYYYNWTNLPDEGLCGSETERWHEKPVIPDFLKAVKLKLRSIITPAHGMLHLNSGSLPAHSHHSPLFRVDQAGMCCSPWRSSETFQCSEKVWFGCVFRIYSSSPVCSVCCCDEWWDTWSADLLRVSWRRPGANLLHKSAPTQKASNVLGRSERFAKTYVTEVQSLFWWRLSAWIVITSQKQWI